MKAALGEVVKMLRISMIREINVATIDILASLAVNSYQTVQILQMQPV